MTLAPGQVWTEEELLELPLNGYKYELADGELHIMSPAGPDHGVVCVNVGSLLREFCRGKGIGVVMDGQAGFYMKNGDVFSPDVSFVSAARWNSVPAKQRKKFFRGSPDLAVEVLSPSEPRSHIERKIEAYLANETKIVWVMNPPTRSVLIYQPGAKPVEVVGDAIITGDTVLPGLSFPASAAFEDLDAV
jgi:Uma2 family endonuclease